MVWHQELDDDDGDDDEEEEQEEEWLTLTGRELEPTEVPKMSCWCYMSVARLAWSW